MKKNNPNNRKTNINRSRQKRRADLSRRKAAYSVSRRATAQTNSVSGKNFLNKAFSFKGFSFTKIREAKRRKKEDTQNTEQADQDKLNNNENRKNDMAADPAIKQPKNATSINSSRWYKNSQISGIIAAVLLFIMLIAAIIPTSLSVNAEENELASANPTMQLAKEYIYAGSRMLSIEDYGLNSSSTPTPSSNTATFVRTDTSTQGNWIGVYGGQGYKLAADGTSLPSWVQVAFSGESTFTWAASTTDTRALQKTANNGDRIAGTWYSNPGYTQGSQYSISFNFTDGQTHQLALYNLDWDSYGPRSQQLEIIDSTTQSVLDTRSVTNFSNGVYVVWQVKGQVTVRVTNASAISGNAVISGFFIDDPNATGVLKSLCKRVVSQAAARQSVLK